MTRPRDIVREEVVSEPGAGITITALHLSEEAKRGLSTGGARIPPSELVPSIDALLHDFRELVYAGVQQALAKDGHCKHYEGTVEYTVVCPSYFERDAHCVHQLELDCYVLGPSRHYKWAGARVEELFARATADVQTWIAENAEEE